MIYDILIGIMFSIPIWMVIEYVVHRYTMHKYLKWLIGGYRTYESHTKLHHTKLFPDGRIVEQYHISTSKYIDDGIRLEFNLVYSSPIWIPIMLFISLGYAIGFIIVAILHATLWTACHHEMHWPTGNWLSRTKWFRLMRIHHWKHHRNMKCNYSVLCFPFMDIIMRTRKQ